MLMALFGMAQGTTKFPITLTKADGLPGQKLVQNYSYKSQVYNLEEETSVLRFTVCSTSNTDKIAENSYDGLSAGAGVGFPFFTLGEVTFFDGDGNKIEYVATSNAVYPGDGGGVAALNDGIVKSGNHFHSAYTTNADGFPAAWHYVEFELAQPVKSFSFNWRTRTGYYHNLITYMGITAGTDYAPFPEQQFQLGEQVTSVEQLAEEGALFVLRSSAPGEYTNVKHVVPGKLFFQSPYGGTETASAADLVCLVPDAEKENAYKVCWLNSGAYILASEYTSGNVNDRWASWTTDATKAATIEFAPCDTIEGNFSITMDENLRYVGFDAIGKMSLIADVDSCLYNTSRPTSYSWAIYKASINGAAIATQLQAEIDEAEARIAAIGGKVANYDEGEYEALATALAEAKEIVAKADVTAAEILGAKKSLNALTTAYAAVGVWAYADSITAIIERVENGDIAIFEGAGFVKGAYSLVAFDAMNETLEGVDAAVEDCETLADVDAIVADIYAAIDAFWASQITDITELPLRIGKAEDGLPGVNTNSVWIWESPTYYLSETVDALRFTVFDTKAKRTCNNGKVFVCINEFELYDHNGNKIPLTEDCFSTTSVADEGNKLAGLCDGGTATSAGVHFHSQWNADADYDGSEYFYLDIKLPEPISGFKYKQYGRGNGYDDVPTDFVFGYNGEKITPEDVDFPVVKVEDPNNAKLGEQITDASQITDDGFYALVGLLNCAPEGNGTGYEKFYTSNVVFGKEIGSAAAFSIRKTEDGDGTFYIQSLADGAYWSRTIDDDGWSGDNTTASSKEDAGKFFIVSNAAAREAAGKEEFPNSFAIYQYNDTLMRDDSRCPYIVVQDWGDRTGFFSIPDLTYNDFDGEGEWYIYKMTMDNPYIYWLNNVCASVNNLNIGSDPGFISEATPGAFASALAQAQAAIDAQDNDAAKAALLALESVVASSGETNPMVPGTYIIESANENFLIETGSKKAILVDINDYENNGASSELSLFWSDAPADYANAPDIFKFEFISATESAKVQEWLAAGTITADQAANAYFIKSVEAGQYAATSVEHARSRDIGLSVEPEEPYIVRSQGGVKFDLWHPSHGNNSMHMEGNSGGSGQAGDIVYWAGTDASSQWILRKVAAAPAEYSIAYIGGENGTVNLSATTVTEGGSVSIEVIPNEGYKVASLLANGKDVTAEIVDGVYTIENVTEDINFEVTFAAATSPNTMYVEALSTTPGDELVIPISMKNEASITAFQLDVYLPEGITIATDEWGDALIELTSDRTSSGRTNHTASLSQLPDGGYRIAVFSSKNRPFTGNDGVVLNITTNVAYEMADGDYELTMKNIRLSTTDEIEYVTEIATSVITVNNGATGVKDGVADEVISINYFTEGGVKIDAPCEGINIVVVKYASGKVESKKVIIKK